MKLFLFLLFIFLLIVVCQIYFYNKKIEQNEQKMKTIESFKNKLKNINEKNMILEDESIQTIIK